MKKSDPIQTGLRISRELRDKLQKQARKSGISLNSEIERRLVSSFEEGQRMHDLMQVMQEGTVALAQHDDKIIADLQHRVAELERGKGKK